MVALPLLVLAACAMGTKTARGSGSVLFRAAGSTKSLSPSEPLYDNCPRKRIGGRRFHPAAFLNEDWYFSGDKGGERSLSVNAVLNLTFPSSSVERNAFPKPIHVPFSTQMESMITQALDCEPFTLRILASVFARHCSDSSGIRGTKLFVDSGANEGLWTLLAAVHGCVAVAIEPQPACKRLIDGGANLSGVESNVVVLNNILSPTPVTLQMGVHGCHGDQQFDSQASLAGSLKRAKRNKFPPAAINSKRLDEIPILAEAGRVIELWHVDVEGAEVPVLSSAARLFARGRIRRVIVSTHPGHACHNTAHRPKHLRGTYTHTHLRTSHPTPCLA